MFQKDGQQVEISDSSGTKPSFPKKFGHPLSSDGVSPISNRFEAKQYDHPMPVNSLGVSPMMRHSQEKCTQQHSHLMSADQSPLYYNYPPRQPRHQPEKPMMPLSFSNSIFTPTKNRLSPSPAQN